MNDTIETNYDDFFGAFEGADGNQTDTAEEPAETATTDDQTAEEVETTTGDDEADEAVEDSEGGDSGEGEMTPDSEKDGTETEAEADKPIFEQKFVVKVNKETREVSYQDAPAWIQKGMDYDRVKGQLETAQQEKDTLQAEVDKFKPHMEMLEQAAEAANVSLEQMLESVQLGMYRSKGMTDAEARAELRNLRLEKQIKDLAKQSQKPPASEPVQEPAVDEKAERAQRELDEFSRVFPDVKMTEELVAKLVPDVQKGMSLTSAYLKMENQRLQAEAQQRQKQEAARKQNTKNRAKTPGSQNDSGGQRTKDAFDDFFGAFEK
jgi:hypothetical protein